MPGGTGAQADGIHGGLPHLPASGLVWNVPQITHPLGLTFLTDFHVSVSHSTVCTWSFTLKLSFDLEPCTEGPDAVPSPAEDTEAQRGEGTAPVRTQQGGTRLGPRPCPAQPAVALRQAEPMGSQAVTEGTG